MWSSIFISLIKLKVLGCNGCLLRATLQWHPHTRICQCWNSGFSVWRRRRVTRFIWDFHYWHEKQYHFLMQVIRPFIPFCSKNYRYNRDKRFAQSGVCFHQLCSHPGLHLWYLIVQWHVSTYVNYIAPFHTPLMPSTQAFRIRHMLPQRTTALMLISTCLNFVRLRHEQHLCENVPTEKTGWRIHAGVLHMFYSWLVEWKGATKEKLMCELKTSMESFYHTAWNLVVGFHLKIHSSNSMMHFTTLALRMGLAETAGNNMQRDVTALGPWQPQHLLLALLVTNIESLEGLSFQKNQCSVKLAIQDPKEVWIESYLRVEICKYGNVLFSWENSACHCHLVIWYFTKIRPPKLTAPPENRPKAKREVVFQPSIFRCKLVVSRRVKILKCLHQNAQYQSLPFLYVFRSCHWKLKQNRFMHLVLQMVGNSFPAPTKTTSNVKQRQFGSTLMEVKVVEHWRITT